MNLIQFFYVHYWTLQVGGFPLPFVVMGLITLATSFLVCILMKQDVPSPNKAKSKWRIVKTGEMKSDASRFFGNIYKKKKNNNRKLKQKKIHDIFYIFTIKYIVMCVRRS